MRSQRTLHQVDQCSQRVRVERAVGDERALRRVQRAHLQRLGMKHAACAPTPTPVRARRRLADMPTGTRGAPPAGQAARLVVRLRHVATTVATECPNECCRHDAASALDCHERCNAGAAAHQSRVDCDGRLVVCRMQAPPVEAMTVRGGERSRTRARDFRRRLP